MNSEVTTYLKAFSTSRRQFMKASAIAAGLGAASHFTPAWVAGFSLGRASALHEASDIDILNYALTLEHLESNLYSTLVASGLATDDQVQTYLEYYGGHESAHVDLLTSAISDAGGDPVQEEGYTFPDLADQQAMLELLVTVEDLGASAYLGAARYIDSPDILTVAIQIHTVEAYHATGFRLLAGQDSVPFVFAEGASSDDVIKAVTPFFMDGLPGTGGGGTANSSGNAARTLGVAGLGAAAIAGFGLARNRSGEVRD